MSHGLTGRRKRIKLESVTRRVKDRLTEVIAMSSRAHTPVVSISNNSQNATSTTRLLKASPCVELHFSLLLLEERQQEQLRHTPLQPRQERPGSIQNKYAH